MTQMWHTHPRDDGFRWVPLSAEHLPLLAAVLRDSVPAHLSRYVVDNQPGYPSHLRRVLSSPGTHPHHRLRALVTASGSLAAFADVRVDTPRPESGFLSSLVVLREFRGRGLASRLFRDVAREFAWLRTLELDVFVDNRRAVRLYESLGFHRIGTQHWLVRAVPPPAAGVTSPRPSRPAVRRVLDELAAVGSARLDRSQTGTGAELRLIGDEVIQTFDAATFTDTALLSAVTSAHGGPRTALLITDSSAPPDAPDIRRIHASDRMRLSDLTDLRARHLPSSARDSTVRK